MKIKFKHCDDYISDYRAPKVLRFFLIIQRLPAIDQGICREFGVEPKLFADYKGKRYRVNMASRLGDVGITDKLDKDMGYDIRVAVADLENFSDKP